MADAAPDAAAPRVTSIQRRDLVGAALYAAAVLALAAAGLNNNGLLTGQTLWPIPVSLAVMLTAAVGTLWRRRAPGVTLAVTGPLAVAELLMGGQISAFILLFEALWAPVVHGGKRLAQISTGAGAAISIGLLMVISTWAAPVEAVAVGLLIVMVAVALPLMWGWEVRTHREARRTAEALARTEQALAAERAGREVEAERRRIAQDLHDLVAGHLSAVTLHARLATTLADEDARERSLTTTRDSARAALRDLRAVIEVLTAEESAGQPQTTLDWDELSARLQVDETGADVDIDERLRGTDAVSPTAGAEAVDPAAGAALLRIASEAVTNAMRHGTAPYALQARLEADDVVFTCTNGRSHESAPGNQLGLVAIAHQARVVGGSATAGPDPADPKLWRVDARLPRYPARITPTGPSTEVAA